VKFIERVSEKIARDPIAVLTRIIELIENLDRESVTAIGIGVARPVDARRRLALSGGYVDLSKIALGDSDRGGIGEGVVIDMIAISLIARSLWARPGRENVAMLTTEPASAERSSKRARSFVARCQLDSWSCNGMFMGVSAPAAARLRRDYELGYCALVAISLSRTLPGHTIDKLFALDAAGDKAARAVPSRLGEAASASRIDRSCLLSIRSSSSSAGDSVSQHTAHWRAYQWRNPTGINVRSERQSLATMPA